MTKYGLLGFVLGLAFVTAKPAGCLPPPDDTPEEVLRTEIITEARSPIDGKPLTAAEYAQLKAQLEERSPPAQVSQKIERLIFLLRLRRLIRTVAPFAPL
jgi:hypothetical protein